MTCTGLIAHLSLGYIFLSFTRIKQIKMATTLLRPSFSSSSTGSPNLFVYNSNNNNITRPMTNNPFIYIFLFFYSFAVDSYNGSVLRLTRLERKQMGAYLCIASNDVPPAVSKRVSLNVHCKSILSAPLIFSLYRYT